MRLLHPVMKRVLVMVFVCCVSLFGMPALHAAAITMQDAIAKVERDTKGKVLSAETKRTGTRVVYRIKVLTHDGRVEVVEVPADG